MEPYSITFELIGFFGALFIVALFAFLETCITALTVFKVKEMAETVPERYKPLLSSLLQNPHRMLITILIAVSLANVTAAALATRLIENLFSQWNLSQGLAFSLGIALTTSMILIFGEIIPKNFAKTHGENLFRSTLWFSNMIFYLMYPFVTFLLKISDFVMYRIAKKDHAIETISSEKEIRYMIDYVSEHALMETEKTDMLRNILNMGKVAVREIMVSEQDIISIDSNTKVEEAVEIFGRHNFSRLPVYDPAHDNIIGFVHQKDILLLTHTGNDEELISDCIRPIMFVPESMRANELLKEFKNEKSHIAIVINEFGSITGLVTLEDTIEEIVGEIHNEYETTTEDIIKIKENGWLVEASTDLQDLSKILNIDFKPASAITLGGFLSEQLQRLPKKGEKTEYGGFIFSVEKATPRRVRQVMIEKQEFEADLIEI
jgi:magnesium and cobalt exporter, CNNM family